MKYFRWQIFLVAYCMMSFASGAGYENQTMAVPLSVFEERYAIDYPTQVLNAGEHYSYAGKSGEFYFIRYSFDDGVTHVVRVPQAHSGELFMQREDRQVLVMKTFKYNFNQGCVLFDPRKQYLVLEEKDGTLLLEVAEGTQQIKAEADRFNLKRVMVFGKKATAAEADSHIASSEISAYLESHPPMDKLPMIENAVEGVCIIETADGASTGFLFAMEGRVYCITNHHVLSSSKALKISTADDRHFMPLYYEVAKDRDLARILLKESPACFQGLGTAKMQESVRILGNSGGEGVVTFDEGKVIGHAPNVIEVDSDFIAGNSGSPVLNQADEVVGVATYVTAVEADQDDWVAKKTRFVKARRFATRLTDSIVWVPMDVNSLRRGELFFEKHLKFIEGTMELIIQLATDPTAQIVDVGFISPDLRSWVLKTNAINRKVDSESQSFRARTQSAYEAGVKKFRTDRINGIFLQIRSLTHLTKRQITQFHQNERSLPALGYYPQQIDELDAQYTFLVEGLAYLSKYFSQLAVEE